MESAEKKVVLLVEDDVMITITEKRALEKYGYGVITVSTGESAIETIDSVTAIDIVLMDINLGDGMDGTEAAKAILEKHDIPLVFLSSHTEKEIVEKTEGITSYGYVVKNSSITVLDASIKMAFKLFDSIKKQKQKEYELEKSESKYRYIFDNAIEGMFRTSVEGIGMMANPALATLLGYDSVPEYLQQMKDSAHQVWYEPGDRETYLAILEKQGMIKEYHCRLKKRDGTIIWVSLNAKIIKDQESGLQFTEGFLTDITKSKLAEMELIKAKEKAEIKEHQYQSLFDEMIDGFAYHQIINDENGNPVDYMTLEVNASYEKLLGVKKEAVTGKRASEILPDKEFNHWLELFSEVVVTGRSIQYEIYSEHNQKYFSGKAYRPESGKFAVTFSDNTARKLAEIELTKAMDISEQNEQRLLLAVESGKLGIWDLDIAANIMVWNDRMFELYGVANEPGTKTLDIWIHGLHPDDKVRAIAEYESAIAGNTKFNTRFRVMRPDGTIIQVKADGTVVRNQENKAVRMIGINRELTN